MEELFLAPVMLRQEVDVVDHEDVRGPEVVTEVLHPSGFDALVEQVHERRARDVADVGVRPIAQDELADRLQQMGLSESHAAVDEIRVVGATRLFRNGGGGHQRQPVSRSDDEVIEHVVRTEHHLLGGEVDAFAVRATASSGGTTTGCGRGRLLTLFRGDEPNRDEHSGDGLGGFLERFGAGTLKVSKLNGFTNTESKHATFEVDGFDVVEPCPTHAWVVGPQVRDQCAA